MKRSRAYKGYSSIYSIEILNSFNSELPLQGTEFAIRNKIIDLLAELRSFKLVKKLVLEFRKIENEHNTIFSIFYSNSKAETIINESDIDDVLESVYSIIISSILKSLEKGSSWITDFFIDHNINISKGNPLAVSSYTKLPKELDHRRKVWSVCKI